MIRVRTLIAAALLSISVLTLSAASPADLSTHVMRESPLPAPQTSFCFFWGGYWVCV
jgi:hypothetical protein